METAKEVKEMDEESQLITRDLCKKLTDHPHAGRMSRIYAGAAMGSMRVLKDTHGLEQMILYCQQYLKDIADESASAN
jgi:hypothetical protein